MLTLTKKTEYGLIALWNLAHKGDAVVSSREIAEETGIPLPILTNILKDIAHAGMVNSCRGASGGYSLSRPVQTITLFDVIEAIEGPVQLVRCIQGNGENGHSSCDLEPRCPMKLPAHRIHHRLCQFLETVTLEELFCTDKVPVEIHATRAKANGVARSPAKEYTT